MTIDEIKKKFSELAAIAKRADIAHIDVMLEVGKLVNEIQILRKYKDRSSAEDEAKQYMRASGCMYGERYIRASWQLAFKLNDSQRRKVYKYQLAIGDIIPLCNMTTERIDFILRQIEKGKLQLQYGKVGRASYQIRLIEAPSKVGKRRQFMMDRSLMDLSRSPDYVSAKVLVKGKLDQDALIDLFSNLISRFPNDAEACWTVALARAKSTNREVAVNE